MGNPNSSKALRTGIYLPHSANWYATKHQFVSVLQEDMFIRSFIEKKYKDAVVYDIVINRTKDFIELIVFCLKPSIMVGKEGSEILSTSAFLKNKTKKEVRIKIYDVKKPEIDAVLVAKRMADDLNRLRMGAMKIIKRHVRNARTNGALGIRIEASGRLLGAQIARRVWFQEGPVPRQKLRANIDYHAQTSFSSLWGTTGVKVWIYKGDNYVVLKKKNIKEGGYR